MDSLESMLRKADLILVKKRPGFVSRLIRTLTKSEYSHVALYVGNNQIIESDIPNGVIKSPITKYDHYDIYRHSSITPEKQKDICDWADTRTGYKYDYMGIFGIFLGILKHRKVNPFDEKGRYWCSELVADAYINSGIFMCVDSQTWTVSPGDLAKCDGFKKMFSYEKTI